MRATELVSTCRQQIRGGLLSPAEDWQCERATVDMFDYGKKWKRKDGVDWHGHHAITDRIGAGAVYQAGTGITDCNRLREILAWRLIGTKF